MSSQRRPALLWIFLFCVSMCSSAQITSRPAPQIATGTIGFSGNAFAGPAVTGAPYSAQEISEHKQTLADGTNIVQKPVTTLHYRDGLGRTRTERSMFVGPNSLGPKIVIISDPVAGYQYTLEDEAQIAHRVALAKWPPMDQPAGGAGVPQRYARLALAPPPPPPPPLAPSSPTAPSAVTGQGYVGAAITLSASDGTSAGPAAPRLEHSSESLGSQVMEGVNVQGTRSTITIPAGEMGNDRPITTVSESWYAPDLKVTVLHKQTDPRSGETTTRLTNIVTAEPDPALFQPPPSYNIVDEAGAFQLHTSTRQ